MYYYLLHLGVTLWKRLKGTEMSSGYLYLKDLTNQLAGLVHEYLSGVIRKEYGLISPPNLYLMYHVKDHKTRKVFIQIILQGG